MKSAIIHDWFLSSIGGAERVIERMHHLFPSPLYALMADREKLKGSFFEPLEIHTSFVQKIPGIFKKHARYLPLFPLAIEQFDLSEYDLILSSSHCISKGVMVHPQQLHICYCHTPMRYAWDLMHEYLKNSGLDRGVKGFFAKWGLHRLRSWDVASSRRVDCFLANSRYVARRIQKYYGRSSQVIYPPVDISFFSPHEKKEDFYVAASRFVGYKKIDLIVEAFAQTPERRLIVIGDGPEREKIIRKAAKNIEILGSQSDAMMKKYLQQARGFIFAALEDFGILPVEAMACGTGVIAFGKGGVKETVIEGKTGTFFKEQTVTSIQGALNHFEKLFISPQECRLQAEKFSQERFEEEYRKLVLSEYAKFKEASDQ